MGIQKKAFFKKFRSRYFLILMYLITTPLVTLLSISANASINILKSDFFNQAQTGSEGPQFIEMEVNKRKLYLLNYYSTEKKSQVIRLKKSVYETLINEINNISLILNHQSYENTYDDQINFCDRELVRTTIVNSKNIVNKNICLNTMKHNEKRLLSLWFSKIQKLFLSKS